MKKQLLFYFGIAAVFVVLFLWVIDAGKALESHRMIAENQISSDTSLTSIFFEALSENLHHPLAILLLQTLVIVFFARIFGLLASLVGQPSVIGEIIAGIVLGPSLVGFFFPQINVFLFPQISLGNLQYMSQLGLILFMFVIGMELDVNVIKQKAQDAFIISHASIVFPYFLGTVLAYFLYENFAPSGVSFLPFALFMGIAMSITAFPVLARIVQERGLTKKPIGTMVITCAAVDDVSAWCLLAAVIAIIKAGTMLNVIVTIVLSVAHVCFMLLVIKPFLNRISDVYASKEHINKTIVALVFLVLLLSSYMTEVIGIHALFGAFLAGVVIPANVNFKTVLTEKVEDLSLVLLLPLFFVFTGLRTQIGLLSQADLWPICGVIILTAVIGKFVGSALPARLLGQSWRESFMIGALMNTRGLMELIVLNIGYDLGILTPEVFTMMVLMALATTLMTGPALNLIDYFFKKEPVQDLVATESVAVKILLSFGPPKMGEILLRLVNQLHYPAVSPPEITALHMTPNSDVTGQEAAVFEKEGFEPIRVKAEELGIQLHTKYRATTDVSGEIIRTAHKGDFDLLIVGAAKSVFSQNKVGGMVRLLLEEVDCNIGVFVAKDFRKLERILLINNGNEEKNSIIDFCKKFISYQDKKLTICELTEGRAISPDLSPAPYEPLRLMDIKQLNKQTIKGFDLVLITLDNWNELTELSDDWLSVFPSVLIVKCLYC